MQFPFWFQKNKSHGFKKGEASFVENKNYKWPEIFQRSLCLPVILQVQENSGSLQWTLFAHHALFTILQMLNALYIGFGSLKSFQRGKLVFKKFALIYVALESLQ